MSVIRVNKTRDYTVMSNCHLKDDRLSLKAVGLMSWMLSLPDEWDYSIAGITACRKKEGKDAIRSALKELEDTGYLIRNTQRDKNGRFATEFILIEEPKEYAGKKKPQRKIRNGKTAEENPTQINTNEISTKNSKEEKKEDGKPSYSELLNSLVTNTEVKEVFLDYLQMRIMQKKAPTNQAVIFLVERLNELSQKPEEQVEIVKQSTRGGYTDFYELKKKQTTKRKSTAKSIPYDPSKDSYQNEDGTYDTRRYKNGSLKPVF